MSKHEKIRYVSERLGKELEAISKNMGTTRSQLLRKDIRKKIDSYPDYLKDGSIEKPKKTDEMKITSMSPKLQEQIENIASNLGIKKATLLRVLLFEIAKDYPEKIKSFTPMD